MAEKKKALSKNQKLFVKEYLKHRNGSMAYKKAYPTCKKDNTARTNASMLLTKPNIKAYVDAGIEKMNKEALLDRQQIMEILVKIIVGEEKDEVATYDSDTGEFIHDKKIVQKNQLKAVEQYGKLLGWDIQKVEMNMQSSDKLDDIINQLKK